MYKLVIPVLLILFFACAKNTLDPEPSHPYGTTSIEAISQRSGDAQTGYEYLITGDYVNSGLPLVMYNLFFEASANELNRDGINADMPYYINAVESFNGVQIVAPTCLQCHAEYLNGELIVGLGNTTSDYSYNQGDTLVQATAGIELIYGANSPEMEAYEPFRRAGALLSDKIITEVRGVSPAARISVVLSAHRNSETLEWTDQRQHDIPNSVVPSDVPAWWHSKKKNAFFYPGSGRGDHAKATMANSILTLQNIDMAIEIESHFPDVMAYLNSIEAPPYPNQIDETKAERGKTLFDASCAQCHGTYGMEETYPNLLVDFAVIRTDSLLATTHNDLDPYYDNYNNSWFGTGPNKAELVKTRGYMAPPLDGIWATAPYLHNGSVPTLEGLLNSSSRPTYWRRTFDSHDIDWVKMGWNYVDESTGMGREIYDTTLPGYGNQGHYFGDFLSNPDRSDLIEYLKTI